MDQRTVILLTLVAVAACGPAASTPASSTPSPVASTSAAPRPDPRIGLRPGLWTAGQASWNMRVVSATRPSEKFTQGINSDLAFIGNYAIQGNFNGYQVWDISNPSAPTLKTAYFCPASQSDVSVYKNLLFVSAESESARLDCGAQGVRDSVSKERIRGIRIFDITDIANPKYVANVQTCRGSHTHTVLVDPKDKDNVYIYISGSSPPRSTNEMQGCINESPEKNPNSALFRIEVIKVPLARPAQAAIVSNPRIFNNLAAPPHHGETPEDIAASKKAAEAARARGLYTVTFEGMEMALPPTFTAPLLDSVVKARGGTGAATSADSAKLRSALQGIVEKMFGLEDADKHGPTQCHDITVYPAIGLAGGACEGYGLLIDIRDPANPVRIGAVADSNFSYWHSATFNNDGSKVLFSDEWGGGGAPKCRRTDKPEWGADAIFTIDATKKMNFQSYYKMTAPQTPLENCVAHNGSLIPIPGRDVMVQAWYQGGLSVFDWTDAKHPTEIAFFDRGPADSTRMTMAGSWSVYWYNGVIVSSEIARGLDILELTPSAMLSQNEIDAAKTVRLEYLNAQGQPQFVWPASFALARAYLDQLERSKALSAADLSSARGELTRAEGLSSQQRRDALAQLATRMHGVAARATADQAKAHAMASAIGELAKVQ
jgi:hypothetical protein